MFEILLLIKILNMVFCFLFPSFLKKLINRKYDNEISIS